MLRDEDDRHAWHHAAQGSRYRETIHLRHVDIQENQVRMKIGGLLQYPIAVLQGRQDIAPLVEQTGEALP